MAKYMFISNRKNAPSVAEQVEYAREMLRLDNQHIFGAKQALYRSCQSLSSALEIEGFLAPLDKVYVLDIMCIGTSHNSIYETLNAYHKASVCLHVVDISYADQLVRSERGYKSENNDYKLLTKYIEAHQRLRRMYILKQEDKRNARDARSKDHRGRPRVPFEKVPSDVQALINKYVMTSSSEDYSLKQLRADLRKVRYAIGQERLYRYIWYLRNRKGLDPRRM